MTISRKPAAPRRAAKDAPAPAAATASGVSPEAAEAAAEDLARKAEAVTRPGQSAADLLAAQRAGGLIRVTARLRTGLRRAGRRWSAEGDTVPADSLTPDQLREIEADPLLTVERVPAKGVQ